MRGEVVQADVVTRRSPGMDAFQGPRGPVTIPGAARCHVVAIVTGPGFLGDVTIRLGLN